MWRSSRSPYVPQQSVEVTADNGLSFSKGKRITLTLPDTLSFISPHESYLTFDLTLSGGVSPAMCREDVGASAIFQSIRVYDNRSGEMIEELSEYATWVANSNHYKLDKSQQALQSATEGVCSGFQVLGNPYFDDAGAFRTTRFCVPLRIGMFQQEDAIPNRLIPLRFEFELERDMAKVVQRINGVGSPGSSSATSPLPASWGNSIDSNPAGGSFGTPFSLEVGADYVSGNTFCAIKGGGISDGLTPLNETNGETAIQRGLSSFPIKVNEKLGFVKVAKADGAISKVETGLTTLFLKSVVNDGTASPDAQFQVDFTDAVDGTVAVPWSGSPLVANDPDFVYYLVSLNGNDQLQSILDPVGDRVFSLDTFTPATFGVAPDYTDGVIYVTPSSDSASGTGVILKCEIIGNDLAEGDISVWNQGSGYVVGDIFTLSGIPGGGDETAPPTIQAGVLTSISTIASTDTSITTAYNYQVDNFRMVVNEVQPGSDYLGRASKGMDYHIKSFQNYRFNIPQTEVRGSYIIPISNSRCYSIFCVPVKQGAYNDVDFDRHNIIHGTRDNLSRFNFQINGMLEPDRAIESVVEKSGQMLEPQWNYELLKAMEGCGITVRNMRDSAQAFMAPIQLGVDMFSRDLRGIDVNLNTEYNGNQAINKLVNVYVCNLRTCKISPMGVTIVR